MKSFLINNFLHTDAPTDPDAYELLSEMDLPDSDSVVSEESEEEIEDPFLYGVDDLQYRGITTFQKLALRRFTGRADFQMWHSEREDIMVIKFVNN